MRQRRTHYEILGVERTASPDEIKRQYRRLAKRYHPDVAATGDAAAAHRAFVRLSQAYETLSDPERRQEYDRELRLQELQEADTSSLHVNSPPPRANGARAASGAHTAGAGPRAATAGPRPRPRADVTQMLFNAQMDASRGRLSEALILCQEIVRRDPRCASAYSLMGDIYRVQRRHDQAVHMYTMAVQLNPGSKEDLAKMERAACESGKSNGARRLPLTSAARVTAAVGTLLAAGLVMLPAVNPGVPVLQSVAFLNTWTDSLLWGMVGAAFLVGFVATITGVTGRLDDEFLTVTVQTPGGALPLGILVMLLSILFYPLAIIAYLLAVVMAETPSVPLARMLVFSAVGVGLFAMTLPAAAGQTLLFGGNVLFPCMILGSFVGSFFCEPW